MLSSDDVWLINVACLFPSCANEDANELEDGDLTLLFDKGHSGIQKRMWERFGRVHMAGSFAKEISYDECSRNVSSRQGKRASRKEGDG